MKAIAKIVNLKSINETIAEMREIVDRYSSDVHDYLQFSPLAFYDFVKKIPYRNDPEGVEFVSRPKHVLDNLSDESFPCDCDDKTVLLASYAREKGIPCRAVVVAKKGAPRPHHIYPQFRFALHWTNCDATFPDRSEFGQALYDEDPGLRFYFPM